MDEIGGMDWSDERNTRNNDDGVQNGGCPLDLVLYNRRFDVKRGMQMLGR